MVTDEERACREIVATRSGGFCEKCGEPGRLEKAHRVARSHGGSWTPANILDLCHTCHHGNHANPTDAYEHGWHLRSYGNPHLDPVLLIKGSRRDWAVLDGNGSFEWVVGSAAESPS